MERIVLALVLFAGYGLALLLFWCGWKRPRALRITLAAIAGGFVAAQTALWHLLYAAGTAWNGGDADGVWIVWLVTAMAYLSVVVPFLARRDTVPSSPAPAADPDTEYGRIR